MINLETHLNEISLKIGSACLTTSENRLREYPALTTSENRLREYPASTTTENRLREYPALTTSENRLRVYPALTTSENRLMLCPALTTSENRPRMTASLTSKNMLRVCSPLSRLEMWLRLVNLNIVLEKKLSSKFENLDFKKIEKNQCVLELKSSLLSII